METSDEKRLHQMVTPELAQSVLEASVKPVPGKMTSRRIPVVLVGLKTDSVAAMSSAVGVATTVSDKHCAFMECVFGAYILISVPGEGDAWTTAQRVGFELNRTLGKGARILIAHPTGAFGSMGAEYGPVGSLLPTIDQLLLVLSRLSYGEMSVES